MPFCQHWVEVSKNVRIEKNGGSKFWIFLISPLSVEIMAFFTLFWVNFWRQIQSSILSFVKNPLYTASSYTKMSLKTSQEVKNSEIVNALLDVDGGWKDELCFLLTPVSVISSIENLLWKCRYESRSKGCIFIKLENKMFYLGS